MSIRLAVGFFALAAAVAPGPLAWGQVLEALEREKAVLEARHAVLTKKNDLATLQEQVLQKMKANRDLEFEILEKERKIEKLKRARRFDVADGDSDAWRRKGHGCVSLGAEGKLFQWWSDLDWVGFDLEGVCETPVSFFGDPLSDNHS